VSEKPVLADFSGGIYRIRLNRPRVHNAIDDSIVDALFDAFDGAAEEPSARVVVLSGEGKSFSAGADLEWMRRQGEAGLKENERTARRLAELFERLDTLDLPVLARIQGAAIGGGVGLVAVSDIAVAAESAIFSLSEVRLGLPPAVISPYLLRKIGMSRARELMLTGRRIGATEAADIGLVHRVVPEAALDEAVEGVIGELLAGGPEAIRRVKRLLRAVGSMLHEDADRIAVYTAREIAAARASAEGRAGTRAFLEKKDPPWAPKD
jgi:methylglutaconyl-CoA hydratase